MASDPVAAIRGALPAGWAIFQVQDHPTPFYRPPGKGLLIVVGAEKDAPQRGQQPKGIHVYVMAPDYEDGGADPTKGTHSQSWPPYLIHAGSQARIYLWPSTSEPEWKSMKQDVLRALEVE